jgi:hypothetical protein
VAKQVWSDHLIALGKVLEDGLEGVAAPGDAVDQEEGLGRRVTPAAEGNVLAVKADALAADGRLDY